MTFIPGHKLSHTLYHDIVAPLMQASFPGLPYTAALLGAGSDVLGFDTERSMDHDWGPRLNILVREEDIATAKPAILAALDTALPESIHGIPVDIPGSADLPGDELRHHHNADETRFHGVRIDTLADMLEGSLGIRSMDEFDTARWLVTPQQKLLELTSGPVFHDGIGDLRAFRAHIAWYPDHLWRYQLATRWKRISQLEAFVGRTGELDDDLGSHIITLALIDDIVHLTFLQERQYAPYAKWLGTAFRRLEIAPVITPHLDQARFARTWQEREPGLIAAQLELGRRHNHLGLSEPVEIASYPFHDRPFQVIFAERFTRALRDAITEPGILALPEDIGGIDQFVDSTDALGSHDLRNRLAGWYRESMRGT
jgi:hypothetical protein